RARDDGSCPHARVGARDDGSCPHAGGRARDDGTEIVASTLLLELVARLLTDWLSEGGSGPEATEPCRLKCWTRSRPRRGRFSARNVIGTNRNPFTDGSCRGLAAAYSSTDDVPKAYDTLGMPVWPRETHWSAYP
ncbi:unnamed protein product, partial [Polarella glacialis]